MRQYLLFGNSKGGIMAVLIDNDARRINGGAGNSLTSIANYNDIPEAWRT